MFVLHGEQTIQTNEQMGGAKDSTIIKEQKETGRKETSAHAYSPTQNEQVGACTMKTPIMARKSERRGEKKERERRNATSGHACRAHVVAGVDEEVEGAGLVQEGQEGDAARDLADHVLDLLCDFLLRLSRLLLNPVAVEVIVLMGQTGGIRRRTFRKERSRSG